MQRSLDYIQALEEERSKIQVFQRELPLCLELVTQAIEACKQQLSGTTTEYNLQGQSESSAQTSSDLPVFEEFIPIERIASHSDGEEQESKKQNNDNNNKEDKSGNDKNSKKSDWLKSVQLWNQTSDPSPKEDFSPRKETVKEMKRNGGGGAFHPFKKEKNGRVGGKSPAVAAASTSYTVGDGGSGGNKMEEKDEQWPRKTRRCWSPELHRRFLQALQELGGSHAATPKQIRELMKIDGLTNDEVKSHLQKYRLHAKRPSSPTYNDNNNNNTQTPQFVVVGSIWVPPEYAVMAATPTPTSKETSNTATPKGIYAPIATLPPPFRESSTPKKRQQRISSPTDEEYGGSRRKDGGKSRSPVASSSTHAKTASQAY